MTKQIITNEVIEEIFAEQSGISSLEILNAESRGMRVVSVKLDETVGFEDGIAAVKATISERGLVVRGRKDEAKRHYLMGITDTDLFASD